MSVIVKAGDTRYPWEDVYWLTSQFHARLASLDTPILGTMVEETMQALKGMQERLQEMYGEIESERIVREEVTFRSFEQFYKTKCIAKFDYNFYSIFCFRTHQLLPSFLCLPGILRVN